MREIITYIIYLASHPKALPTKRQSGQTGHPGKWMAAGEINGYRMFFHQIFHIHQTLLPTNVWFQHSTTGRKARWLLRKNNLATQVDYGSIFAIFNCLAKFLTRPLYFHCFGSWWILHPSFHHLMQPPPKFHEFTHDGTGRWGQPSC